jgi:hypothetical protein
MPAMDNLHYLMEMLKTSAGTIDSSSIRIRVSAFDFNGSRALDIRQYVPFCLSPRASS